MLGVKWDMRNRSFYNAILTEHNLHPLHKKKLARADIVLEGVNPSCGDDIWLQLQVEDEKIKEGAFWGEGCAISQASTDIMLELVIGKSKNEALKLIETFMEMIKGNLKAEELDSLEEAVALQDISHMPARVKCAVLGWHTLKEMIE